MKTWEWDLSVLYASFDDPKIEQDFARVDAILAEGNACLQSGAADKDVLEKCVDLFEEMICLASRLGSFANLTMATDATHELAAQLMDRLMMKSVEIELFNSAFTRFVGGVGDLTAIVAQSEKLQNVAFSLKRTQDAASHLMDEAIEPWMLKMSLSGSDAFSNLRDKLDGTLLVEYRGEQIPLAAVRGKAYDPDKDVRKDAYDAEIASYAKIEIPMAAALNAIKGEAITMTEAKHYDSVLQRTLDQSNMDQATLDAMWEAIVEALPAFRRYLRKKGELLGYTDGLPFFCLFAPVSKGEFTPKTYTIEEARDKLIADLGKFTPDMGAFVKEAFDNNWIDVYPKEGKGGGAFCADLHQYDQSRVLTNFVGSFSDVSTLAHELGHAWHNRCMKGMPNLQSDAPMPLAETASIFNETLLAHAAMKDASAAERFTLIEGDLMECTQTVVDIYGRFLFESAVIEARKNRTLSVNELKNLMLDAQEKSYGDGLSKEFRHPYMWACKSHYYSAGYNFYNFPYAFGMLFGKGVFAQYLDKGAAFVPQYNQLLRNCGSGMVADVAASVGIDVRSVDFWRASLKVVTDQIDTFIALADE